MGRIERVESKEPFEVIPATLIDPSKFPFPKEGAGPGLIGDIANVLGELFNRDREAKNSQAVSAASEARRITELEMLAIFENNPNPDTWGEETRAILARNAGNFSQLRFGDAETQALQRIKQDGFQQRSIMRTGISSASQNIDNAIAVSGTNLIAFEDDGSPEVAQEKLDMIDQHQQDLERKYPKDVAAIHLEQTLQEAEKMQARNVRKEQMDLAAGDPDLITNEKKTGAIDIELAARAKGEKVSQQLSVLSNTDLEAIRDYANTVGDKIKTDSEIALEAATVDAYARIRDGDADIDRMIDEFSADMANTDEDKIKFAEKVPTYFNKFNSTKIADETNENVYDQLTQATEAVERGAMSPTEFEELYADKKEFLTGADQRLVRSRDIVATKTMQNRIFGDAMVTERPTFIEATEDTIGAIKLARKNAEVVRDIPSINNFNIALKKNQAQQWNFGRFRNELRSQMNQNPEWSSKQINTAKALLIDQLDLTDDELLRSFDNQNPNKAITKNSPDAVFDDIWKNLSLEDRTLIWAGRMQGVPVNALLTGDAVIEAQKK